MIAEALEYIFRKSRAEVQLVGEQKLPYTDKAISLICPPEAPTVGVENLRALVSLTEDVIDDFDLDKCFVQVDSPTRVDVYKKVSSEFGKRHRYMMAAISDACPFGFGRYMTNEEFVICLQTMFVEDAQQEALLKLVSSLSAENVMLSEDDGISQTATVRQGIAMKGTKKVDPKVKLRPFRTFREVTQPASMFLFRMKNVDGAPPACALFEADGGAWKLEACQNIGKFLVDSLGEATIIF